MTERYPGYDVLAKRCTPSWNEPDATGDRRAAGRIRASRASSAGRMAQPRRRLRPDHAAAGDRAAGAACRAYVDQKMHRRTQSTAIATPRCRRRARHGGAGLAALDAEARDAHGAAFRSCARPSRMRCCAMQEGELRTAAWGGMPPRSFFEHRVIPDIVVRLLRASRPPGTRSASAVRRARAAMCGWG